MSTPMIDKTTVDLLRENGFANPDTVRIGVWERQYETELGTFGVKVRLATQHERQRWTEAEAVRKAALVHAPPEMYVATVQHASQSKAETVDIGGLLDLIMRLHTV